MKTCRCLEIMGVLIPKFSSSVSRSVRQHLSGILRWQGCVRMDRPCCQTRCPAVYLSRPAAAPQSQGSFLKQLLHRSSLGWDSVTLALERNSNLLQLWWWLPREVDGTATEDDPTALSWYLWGSPLLLPPAGECTEMEEKLGARRVSP